MHKYTIGRHGLHRKHSRYLPRHFAGLSFLSVVLVFVIAVLLRSELRLSGELLAAGDASDLALLTRMQSYERVELVRETDDVRLYVLSGGRKDYLVETIRMENGEWRIESVEELH